MEYLKNRLITKILYEKDWDKLNHLEYILNIDEVKGVVKTIFASKKVPVTGYTFDYIVHNLIPEIKVDFDTKIAKLQDLSDGALFETDRFMYEANKGVVDINAFLSDDRVDIKKFVNYLPDDWSSSAVGKGELFFTLFLEGATKSNDGGDLNYRGTNLELKGKEARLCSQSSHANPSSIKSKIKAKYEELAYRRVDTLPIFSGQNVDKIFNQSFYYKRDYVNFLQYTFNEFAIHASLEDFAFVEDCVSDNAVLDFEKWKYHQAIFEYGYYTKYEKHDAILFINPEKMKALLTRTQEDVIKNYDAFSIRAGYNWNFEKGKALMWTLK